MLDLLLLPFKIVGALLKALYKIVRFLSSNLLGTMIVATIAFLLGMKYIEYRQKKEGHTDL